MNFNRIFIVFLIVILISGQVIAENDVSTNLKKCVEQKSKLKECDNSDNSNCSSSEVCADLNLEKVTVMGTRTEVSINKYPGSANQLGQDDLTDSNSTIESLSKIPGVETGGGHGRNIGQQYTIRGFGYQSESRVIIKMDGVRRSPSLFSNHISTFRSDNDLLTSIDVVKGASSISHGGGAIGGVIGMTTKDAYDFLKGNESFGATIKARYENNNHRSGYMAFYGVTENDQFDFLLYNKSGKTGKLRLSKPALEVSEGVFSDEIDNKEEFHNMFFKLGYNPNHNHRFTLSHFDSTEDTEVTWQTVYHSTYSSVTGPVIGELEQTDTVFKYMGSSDHTDLFNIDLLVFDTKSSYFRTLDYVSNDLPTHVDYENADKRRGMNIKNLMLFDTGSVMHRLLLGFDYEKRNEDALYVRNGIVSDFGSMPNEYKDAGFYIQEEAHMFNDRLIAFLGGRYDSFKRSVHNGAKKYDNDRFSPRFGVALRAAKGFYLLGNFSESFRAPTPHETSSEGPLNPHYWYLPNPDLKPEKAAEYELGFSFSKNGLWFDDDRLSIKAMYFRGKIKDMISFRERFDLGVSPDDSPYGQYMNVADARRKGLEFEMSYQKNRWDASFTYEKLNQYDSETGEKIPNAFADKIRVSGSYYFSSNVSVGMDISHWLKPEQNPQSVVFRGERYFYVNKPYTIANIKANWKPRETGYSWIDGRFELEGGINNITDQDYLNARNIATTSRVGKGRNIYLSASVSF